MTCCAGLSSGDSPAPVAQPGDNIHGSAERRDVGADDIDARDLAMLDFGDTSLGHAEGTGKLGLRHPGRGAHFAS
jgi:hypothetical protein